MLHKNLKVVQTRQKNYVDQRRRDLSFEISDFIYLKALPMRGPPPMPPHHHMSLSEAKNEFPVLPSLFFIPAGEFLCPGAAGG
jgi:hypothetical protein